MNCMKCGREIGDDQAFCEYCLRSTGFDTMPDDIIVCMRRFPNSEAGELLYGRTEAEYQANVELFNEMFAYKD